MKNKWLVTLLSLALAVSIALHFVPASKVTASGLVEFKYAYDSESVHEKIDGDLMNDAVMEGLVYLLVMKNPDYVEGEPNSGEWYIVTLRESEAWNKRP